MRVIPAFAIITVSIWTTRIGNIWSDESARTGDKVASTALALSFTAFALTTALLLWRRSASVRPVVLAFAAWTGAVWTVRMASIATGDRGATFIAVHAALAVVSIVLAVAAAREVGDVGTRFPRPEVPKVDAG